MGDISTAFVKQFSNNIMLLSQQKGSKLRNSVLSRSDIVGEDWYIDAIDKSTARTKSTRNSDVEYSNSDYQRRKLSPITLYDSKLLDKEDKVKMLADPTSPEAMGIAYAIGRGIDDQIITAAFGAARTGKEGDGTENFTSDNVVGVGAAGLNLAKLLAAKEILDDNDVDPDEERFIALGSKQIQDLLKIEEFTSADYNTIKALVMGARNAFTFIGFTFIPIANTLLDTDTNGYRRVIVWAKNGLAVGFAKEMNNRIDVMPGKHYATQVYGSIDVGAVRADMDKVVEIKCLET